MPAERNRFFPLSLSLFNTCLLRMTQSQSTGRVIGYHRDNRVFIIQGEFESSKCMIGEGLLDVFYSLKVIHGCALESFKWTTINIVL